MIQALIKVIKARRYAFRCGVAGLFGRDVQCAPSVADVEVALLRKLVGGFPKRTVTYPGLKTCKRTQYTGENALLTIEVPQGREVLPTYLPFGVQADGLPALTHLTVCHLKSWVSGV